MRDFRFFIFIFIELNSFSEYIGGFRFFKWVPISIITPFFLNSLSLRFEVVFKKPISEFNYIE